MEEANYKNLIKTIEQSTKKSYLARTSNNKQIMNVANYGGKKGDIAKLERTGEYYGIAVELMEDLKPLLTDLFVVRLLLMLKKEDYVTPLAILNLTSMDQLQYILHTWFSKATTEYDNSLEETNKKYPLFDDWINTVAHDPILGKIKIVEIGYNQSTGNSVVPSDWIDRTFNNGETLHKEMDKLETRLGKPPVTYAVIYSMILQQEDTIINDAKNIKFTTAFYLDWIDNKFQTSISVKLKTGYQYVKYNNTLIGFKLNDILEQKNKSDHTQSSLKEVGVLVSRLQKAIRRGRYGSKVLSETIDAINISPNYNLPEYGFLRVSASKQLVWRLFITILEDCRPYQPIDEPSLLDLLLLVLITQRVQEYKFKKPILKAIKKVAILAQYNDTKNDLFDWRSLPIASKTPLTKKSDFHNAISLAIDNIIMMAGDNKMLRHYYSEKNIFEPFDLPDKKIYHDQKVYDDIILSSFDMHCKTQLILYYQACIPISLTTKQISGYIWDVSSSYNVRATKSKPINDTILKSIQQYFANESVNSKSNQKSSIVNVKEFVHKYQQVKPDTHARRTSFLILFGQKYRYNGKEIVLAGTGKSPARVKIDNEWKYCTMEKNNPDDYYCKQDLLNAYPRKKVVLTDIDPPFGYKWKKTKVITEIINGEPIIDGQIIPFFDGSSLLESITPIVTKSIDKSIYKLIIQIFSGIDIDFQTLLDLRKKYNILSGEIYNWLPSPADIKKLSMDLVKLTYTKIFNQFNNIITIGPVSRTGNKMQNSINYLLEGKLWAVFNLLTYLYPTTFKPSGGLNFYIKKETSGYVHLIKTLESILFDNVKIKGDIPSITTQLWDHQLDSSNRILAGFQKRSHGFGDASIVGSGKTLTSLNIAVELIKQNNRTHSGVLVMLPGNKLIKTWQEELEKHTEDFDIIFQENTSEVGPIKRNTIVITTMGRNRDHPINHKWLLVIIDECLTVQNRNALWTENAWVQSMMAKYLVMMSATFFRTRFDKLYYMLKMLKTGLPERREYLDAILLESIVSQVSNISRKWTSTFNYFKLDSASRKEYDAINSTSLSTELKFAKLTSFLVSNSKVNNLVTKQLGLLINKLEKAKRRCLIYARAQDEAKLWSSVLGIPIYPSKGKHCIVTYHDGTYGLNDLVIYDTIIMRPPAPDKLPQIKGRLDRPGQKLDDLHIEYFVLKNTIEEGLILRLNIASQFVQKYIMPLSKFYDISVNYQKYLEEI